MNWKILAIALVIIVGGIVGYFLGFPVGFQKGHWVFYIRSCTGDVLHCEWGKEYFGIKTEEECIKIGGKPWFNAGWNEDYRGCIPTSNKPTPVIDVVPVGLHYINWFFDRMPRKIQFFITIHDMPSNKYGLYFQMYQGMVNDVGTYFGIQQDDEGKRVIFSRWGTRNLANARVAPGGWSQSTGYEGDFIGVRQRYDWDVGKYRMVIAYTDSDSFGDWYAVRIRNESTRKEEYMGSLRFPIVAEQRRGIINSAPTWTELYAKESQQTQVPTWHVSIDGVHIDDDERKPYAADTSYSNIPNTDIVYDPISRSFHLYVGVNVKRIHQPAHYDFPFGKDAK